MSQTTDASGSPETTLEELRSITTADDAEDYIRKAKREQSLVWKRVGGMNNTGTIESGSGPKNALGERETNGIDAIIERKALDVYGDIDSAREALPDTPRKAVIELFDLPDAGLSEAEQSKIATMAERLRVVVHESNEEERDTIVLRDKGIGQHPKDFADTFVSLHGDNKNTKPFLIGRFGQGGSNAYRPARYTIIISRSHNGGPIGWTIVRRNKNHELENGDITTAYEYLALPTDGVPRFDAPAAPDFTGTEVRLVEYRTKGFSGSTESRLKRTNVAGLTGHLMFGSVYPIRVEDEREGSRSHTTVKGNRTLLNDSKYVDEVEGERTQGVLEVPTEYGGDLTVRYWVVDPSQSGSDDSKRDIVNRFVDPTNPMVFTLSGQIHHEETKRTLENTGHGFLKDRMIVEVDFDDLDENRRDLVFSSTRDRAMEGEEYDHVKTRLVDALTSDEELNALNEHYREKALEGGNSAKEAKDDLASLMSSYDIDGDGLAGVDLEGSENGGDSRTDESGQDETGTSSTWSPDHVPDRKDEPTFMEIANPEDPLLPRQGGTMSVRLRLDAKDAFDDRDDVQYDATVTGDAHGHIDRQSERPLKNGNRYITFRIDDDVEIGTTGNLRIRLTWNGGDDTLTVTRDLEVEEPKDWSETKSQGGSSSPEVIPVEDVDNSPFSNGDRSVVMYVEEEDEADKIFVALFNKHVEKILDKVTRSENTLNRYAREYMAHIAFYEVMRQSEREADEEDGATLDEEARLRELNRYARVLMQSIAKNVDPENL